MLPYYVLTACLRGGEADGGLQRRGLDRVADGEVVRGRLIVCIAIVRLAIVTMYSHSKLVTMNSHSKERSYITACGACVYRRLVSV